LVGDLDERGDNRPDVGAAETRRTENDSRMRTPLRDGVATERAKVPRVPTDQAPLVTSGEFKPLLVANPDVTDFMCAHGIHALSA
jgi:hypothetical protein